MKKVILTFAFALLPVSLFAQFALTPTGFVNKNNPEQDYYVLEFPGRTKAELFNSTMAWLSSKYSSRNDQFTVAEGEMITLNGWAYNGVSTAKGVFGSNFDVWFSVQIEFRDGRIRIMRPLIRSMIKTVETTKEVIDKEEIRDKSGKVVETRERKRTVPATSTTQIFISPHYLDGDERPNALSTVIFNKKNALKKPFAKESLEDYFNTMVYGLFRHLSSPGDEW